MVLRGFPIGKRGQLLRDRLEQSNNDADRSRFHVGTEFINRSSVLVSSISKARTNFWGRGNNRRDSQECGNGSRIAFPPRQPEESKLT